MSFKDICFALISYSQYKEFPEQAITFNKDNPIYSLHSYQLHSLTLCGREKREIRAVFFSEDSGFKSATYSFNLTYFTLRGKHSFWLIRPF